MRMESAKLWTDFLEQFEGVHVYTVDPGAHAIAVELVPLIAGLDLFAGWFAEGWSARERPECRSVVELTAALDIGTTLILGSQTDFGRTQGLLRAASAAGARTIFVFDHWKNFAEHFGGGPLPDAIVVPDQIGRALLLAEIGEAAASRVLILPHLAVQAATDRVRARITEPTGIIAVLLDPTEPSDALGYDWRSTLDAVAALASERQGRRFLIKPHPRQKVDVVAKSLAAWSNHGIVYELFDGEAESLIAAADEVWGMTTIALNIALAAGKPIRSLQIGRNAKGRRASNPHIEPFAIIQATSAQ